MRWNWIAIAATFLVFATSAGAPQARAQNNCQFGEKLDSSTAADARKRLESAGFSNIRIGKKGCDNVWHATAAWNGSTLNVALTPQGQIFHESE